MPDTSPLQTASNGRPARGICNRLMEELNRKETEILPLQRGLVRNLSIQQRRRADRILCYCGQGKAPICRLVRCIGSFDLICGGVFEAGY